VAVRSAPAFAATANVTDPLPLPLAPWLMVRNAALLVDVHAHPDAAATVAVPVPPSGPNVVVVGWVTLNEQVGVVGVPLLLSLLHAAVTIKPRHASAARDARELHIENTPFSVRQDIPER
jgi:hypothetical protein